MGAEEFPKGECDSLIRGPRSDKDKNTSYLHKGGPDMDLFLKVSTE